MQHQPHGFLISCLRCDLEPCPYPNIKQRGNLGICHLWTNPEAREIDRILTEQYERKRNKQIWLIP